MKREEHRHRGIRYDYLTGSKVYASKLDLDEDEDYTTSSLTVMLKAIDDMLAYYDWEHGERESS